MNQHTHADGFGLATDLYQLTMMQAYWKAEMSAPATFDLFVRSLPEQRRFLVAAGLESALDYLETVSFTNEDLGYLEGLGLFEPGFLLYLGGFRFSGEVRAVPEGTVVFAQEPILEVTAPIAEAQLVETFLLNQITFQTVIASKAARVVLAASGRPVSDFGMRRMHGWDAAMQGARAMVIGGVSSTSNVFAGRQIGIPVAGTMAHSYIEAHESEHEAFRRFAKLSPSTTILVDTYDTLTGVKRAISVAREGVDIGAIRLDSGDLQVLARESRRMLDDAGMADIKIFASGGLDEWSIAELVAADSPIDGFGVGTRMGTSADAPVLDSVYKLSAYAGEGRMKLSEGKETFPGRKQVFRQVAGEQFTQDVIGLVVEELSGEPLLEPVMIDGHRIRHARALPDVREHAERQISMLPPGVRRLDGGGSSYPVSVSDKLSTYRDRVKATLSGS